MTQKYTNFIGRGKKKILKSLKMAQDLFTDKGE